MDPLVCKHVFHTFAVKSSSHLGPKRKAQNDLIVSRNKSHHFTLSSSGIYEAQVSVTNSV